MLRLASLLSGLRRATTMETGLFEIQADHLSGFRQARQVQRVSREVLYSLFRAGDSVSFDHDPASIGDAVGTGAAPDADPKSVEPAVNPAAELARCFVRLANLPNYALDRLSRYEATLWRQVAQILFALDTSDRRDDFRPIPHAPQYPSPRNCHERPQIRRALDHIH